MSLNRELLLRARANAGAIQNNDYLRRRLSRTHELTAAMRRWRLAAIGGFAAVGLAAHPPAPQAASFNCSVASNRVEAMICEDADLSALDDRLAAAYTAAKLTSDNVSQLILVERAWMLRRNQCRTATCISDIYLERLGELGAASAAVPSTPLRSATAFEVALVEEGGVLTVPVVINGAIKLDFVIDIGASDVIIPADVVLTLTRTRTITDDDFIGDQVYQTADGRSVPSKVFRIRSLQVGSRMFHDVRGSVSDPTGPLLLGQSFLRRFRSWSIDNQRKVLVLQ